jgi:putative transposase
MGIKRRRLGAEGWRGLLARFATSGLTAEAFCRRESVSPASFYRWRALIGGQSVQRSMVAPAAVVPEPVDFVDLGALRERSASSPIDLHLDLGGGLSLHLVRN